MEISFVWPDMSDFEVTLGLLDPGDGAPGSGEQVLNRPGPALPPAAAGSRPGEVVTVSSAMDRDRQAFGAHRDHAALIAA
jgi:hypothetical protein